MNLHDTIKNFYIKTIRPFFKIEVLAENGWREIKSFNITEKTLFYKVQTDNHTIICTKNHIIIDENNEEILAIQSLGRKIKTNTGIEKVIAVTKTEICDNAYDLSLKSDTDHLYYCDGILSHNCIVCDEFAFLQKNLADKLFTSMYPTISSSKEGKFIIVSTPNGTDNLYYDIWQQANSKDKSKNLDGWRPFSMYWWQVPGHDEKWKQKQIAAIGQQRFAQEFNNEFLANSSTHKLVPDDKLEQFRMKLADLRAKNETGMKQRISSAADDRVYEFTVWKAFDKSRTYMASGDTAEGVGGDASVLYIWDVTDLSHISMCAKYDANDVSLVEFAYVCRKILALYGDPPLFAERNGVSAGMLESLRVTYGYQNIATEGKDGDAGIYSHVTIKGRANLWAREMLTTDGFGFEIPDKDLVDEMQTFVKKDTKGHFTVFQAAPGAHDDHMMSFVWGCWALSEEVIQKYFNITGVFKNSFGQQQPAKLAPLSPYSADALNALEKDKAYLDYVSFRQQAVNRYAELMQQQQREDRNDVFKYKSDDYFEDSWSGADWNTGNNDITMPNETVPVYFI